VLGVYVFAAVWRVLVYRGRWSFPGRWVKVALILSAFVGIFVSYGSLLGLEPTVALLLTASALKLIELARRKDAYVLLFLGYFVCITAFLFSQDLLIVVYSFFSVTLITTALVALHQPGEHEFNRGTIRHAGVMLLQALPLMVVLFFLFPRFDPLWTVPIKSHSARTGVSDFMKPGDISRLGRSDEVAFRVEFEGEIPPASQLYWRGLVFSKLREDGAWTRLTYYNVPATERRQREPETSGEPLLYSIIMEPSQQNWLYSLRYARSDSPRILHSNDFSLYSPVQIEDEMMYSARSWPEAVLEPQLSDWRRRTELSLPPGQNPRTRQLAREMMETVDGPSEFVTEVLSLFNAQPFVYTLQPPALPGDNAMDRFMFETRRGFCEHYANAFVVMMRAAGVPARVIAGYQGGEINPVNRTVIVHQFDAHAWAEVWLEGQGWVRVDPTGSVSPARIELGLEEAMAEEGSFLKDSPLSLLRFRSVAWLNLLRYRYDALTYRWQAWVVAFDSERQLRLLQDVFGELSASKFAAALIGTWVLVLAPVAVSLLYRRRTHPMKAMDKYYLGFCKRLGDLELGRAPGETPGEYAQRVESAAPELAGQVREITGIYNELAYAEGGPEAREELLLRLRRAVRTFRPRRGAIAAS
jgi:transglutaminase-like putative cysteine protease